MSGEAFLRQVGPVRVWRCTEAVDSAWGYTFRTVGNDEGRCVEIAAPSNTMLFDRRLAREIALAILAVCGPEEELPSDLAQAEMVEIVYAEDNPKVITGFRPYVTRTGSLLLDAAAFAQRVRRDAGLPASRLFPDYPEDQDA